MSADKTETEKLVPDCQECQALCCKRFDGHYYAVCLSPEEARMYEAEGIEVSFADDHDVLPYKTNEGFTRSFVDECVCLVNNKCSIYDHRPEVCKRFDCNKWIHNNNRSILTEIICKRKGITL